MSVEYGNERLSANRGGRSENGLEERSDEVGLSRPAEPGILSKEKNTERRKGRRGFGGRAPQKDIRGRAPDKTGGRLRSSRASATKQNRQPKKAAESFV